MATKDPNAVALGRKGGLKKVPKGFSALSPEERTANASRGATAMWAKKRASAEKKTKKT